MKRDDLKTGMVLEFQDGTFALVLRNRGEGFNDVFGGYGSDKDNDWGHLGHLPDDLQDEKLSNPVIKVWGNSTSNKYAGLIKPIERNLLWARKETVKHVPLNNDYTAIVNATTKTVEVGCQTIPFSKIREVITAIEELQK